MKVKRDAHSHNRKMIRNCEVVSYKRSVKRRAWGITIAVLVLLVFISGCTQPKPAEKCLSYPKCSEGFAVDESTCQCVPASTTTLPQDYDYLDGALSELQQAEQLEG